MKFVIESNEPPVVEIDSTTRAVYIRFRRAKVAKTVSRDATGALVAIDLDRNGQVVGVELIGVQEFGLTVLLRKLSFIQANVPVDRVRYMPTKAARFNPDLQPA